MEILGGPLFAVSGGGESHGPAIVTIVHGCPPGLYLCREDIQAHLDRRRPGSTKHVTPRKESDQVFLLSGLYQEDLENLLAGPPLRGQSTVPTYGAGLSTGEPIAALVLSQGSKSHHYQQFSGPTGSVRPGHTDLVKYHQSRGFVDIRGGGRSSYRSTITDVVGGSVARLYLRRNFGTRIFSAVCQVGPLRARTTLEERVKTLSTSSPGSSALSELIAGIRQREIPCLDSDFEKEAGDLIRQTRIEGDSLGAAVEVVAVHVPPLLGSPLYNSLKVRLMGALGGLHAAQSCEIGDGFSVVHRKGSENNDPIRAGGYVRNSHGGLIGGVTTGSPLTLRVGFKPTSSIPRKQESVRKDLQEEDFELLKGRHDPCVGIRAGVTLESRVAIELMNALLVQQSRQLDRGAFDLF